MLLVRAFYTKAGSVSAPRVSRRRNAQRFAHGGVRRHRMPSTPSPLIRAWRLPPCGSFLPSPSASSRGRMSESRPILCFTRHHGRAAYANVKPYSHRRRAAARLDRDGRCGPCDERQVHGQPACKVQADPQHVQTRLRPWLARVGRKLRAHAAGPARPRGISRVGGWPST